MALGEEADRMAGGGASSSEGGGGRKGVDSLSSSTASSTSSWSRAWRCGGGAGAAELRSCEDSGMLEVIWRCFGNEEKGVGGVERLSGMDLLEQ